MLIFKLLFMNYFLLNNLQSVIRLREQLIIYKQEVNIIRGKQNLIK